MKIAVVGSGISGLSAAYYLSKKHYVDLFEKEDHFGGHSYTIDILINNQNLPVDIGFIVFNLLNYPNLTKFFEENEIKIEKSNMSFSVSVRETNIEYCGKGISGIFCNKSNIFNIKFLKMFFEIINFYKKSENLTNFKDDITLGEYLKKKKLSKFFIDFHIIPMVAAIWSMPPYEAKQMPLKFFIKFFQNHGLFKFKNRPQWYTVSNRSKTYVNKVLNKITGEHYKNYKINKIESYTKSARIYYGGENEFFDYDKVVVATHADEALNIIKNLSSNQISILSKFKYKENIAIIHSDDSAMPKNKKAWCSWNSSIDQYNPKNNSVTYWLNLLQNLKTNQNIFLTLNPFFEIKKNKIYKKVKFTHPYFNKDALENQSNLHLIQNKKNILFTGSYFGYGFHEDGIKSSIQMIKQVYD